MIALFYFIKLKFKAEEKAKGLDKFQKIIPVISIAILILYFVCMYLSHFLF